MSKTLTHSISMQKNHEPQRTFSGFSQIFVELCSPKSNFTEVSLTVSLSQKPSIENITIKLESSKT